MLPEVTPTIYSSCPANQTYRSSIWATRETKKGPPKLLLKPLQKVQIACLKSITGRYKQTAIVLLKKEANIPPYNYILKPMQYKGCKRNATLIL